MHHLCILSKHRNLECLKLKPKAIFMAFFGLTMYSYEPMDPALWLALWVTWESQTTSIMRHMGRMVFLGWIVTTIKLLATLLGAHNFWFYENPKEKEKERSVHQFPFFHEICLKYTPSFSCSFSFSFWVVIIYHCPNIPRLGLNKLAPKYAIKNQP